jgi:hypothetical protein
MKCHIFEMTIVMWDAAGTAVFTAWMRSKMGENKDWSLSQPRQSGRLTHPKKAFQDQKFI